VTVDDAWVPAERVVAPTASTGRSDGPLTRVPF
jgi:hypothetical protein